MMCDHENYPEDSACMDNLGRRSFEELLQDIPDDAMEILSGCEHPYSRPASYDDALLMRLRTEWVTIRDGLWRRGARAPIGWVNAPPMRAWRLFFTWRAQVECGMFDSSVALGHCEPDPLDMVRAARRVREYTLAQMGYLIVEALQDPDWAWTAPELRGLCGRTS